MKLFDCNRYVGEGLIGHLVKQLQYYGKGVPHPDNKVNLYKGVHENVTTIGVDGCKCGLREGSFIL